MHQTATAYADIKNVKITRQQFNHFVESMSIRGLTSEHLIPLLHESGNVHWSTNNPNDVQLNTSDHPVYASGAIDLVIFGSKSQVAEALSILSILGVPLPMPTHPTVGLNLLEADIEYHTNLNPVLWDKKDSGYDLKSEIEEVLLEAAARFIDFLKTPSITITDITLTGSCANYNWTSNSDIDLHIVVDMKKSKEKYGELLPEYFDAKKRVWNDLHDIRIKNIPVEFYVQDQDEKHHSTGIYSLQDSEWINTPTHNPPTIDDIAVKEKVAALIRDIDAACTSNKASVIEELHKKLVALRKRGLERGGEFSTENVAFKQLRSKGYLDKLAQCKVKAFDRELSIEDEEWIR